MKIMPLTLYQLAIIIFSPLIVLLTLRDAKRRDGGWRFIKQRLGFAYTKPSSRPIWFHAASLGEVNALVPLVKLIQHNKPNESILITTNTPSGAQAVQKLDSVIHAYLPVDWPWAVYCFLKSYQPKQSIVVETELWPNLFSFARRFNCAPVIINGRLSSKTTQKRWAQSLYKVCLDHTTAIYTRSESDSQAYIALGADKEKVKTLGNLKFSGAIPNADELPRLIARPYFLAASTHYDEERQLCQALLGHIEPLLVIIPRHPERLNTLLDSLSDLSLNIAVRSRNDAINQNTDVYLADTMGEMMPFMNHAEMVFMGGSLIEHGGQNMLEAARLGKAIVMGPSIHNFQHEVAALSNANAIRITNKHELQTTIQGLLKQPDELTAMGQRAKELMKHHEQVAQKYYEEIFI